MKFCPECGYHFTAETEKFCPSCGYNISKGVTSSQANDKKNSVNIENTGDVFGVGISGSGNIIGKMLL